MRKTFSDFFDMGNHYPFSNYSRNCEGNLNKLTNFKFKEESENFYTQFINNSFLANKKEPYLIFSYNKLFSSEKCSNILKRKVLTQEEINFLNKNTFSVYICEKYSCESLNEKIDFEDEGKNLLKAFDTFAKKNEIHKIKIYTCESNVNFLNSHYDNLEIYSKNIFLSLVSYKMKNENKYFTSQKDEIIKKFWCGNLQYRYPRHAVSLFLKDRTGNFSWNFKQKFENEKTEKFLSQLKKYNTNYYKLILKNDVKNMMIEMDSETNSSSDSIKSFYRESFCAIVTETFFKSPHTDISEKTLYAICYGRPFIVVGTFGVLKHLKKLGFKTFNEFWDESYDEEEDPYKRLFKIFDLIEYVDSLSMRELQDWYQNMIPILEHNIEVLKSLQYNDEVFE